MPATVGAPRTYHKKFKFVVEIDDFVNSGFQKCSELSIEVAKVEQREGGALIPYKEPGLVTVSDVTLERGATDNFEIFTWFKQVADLAANRGIVTPGYRRNLDIVQQDRDGTPLRRWRLKNAWPTKFVGGDWDNNASENVIESVTLTFDFPDIVT